MKNIIVEPEFRDKIPPLSADEFSKLEENILADGEVREPLVLWNNTIIDGHHRWAIIQKHPHIPYKVKHMEFADKWEAIVWMCRNQLGRRNVTDEQKTILIGEAYRAQKMTQGGNHGNQYTKVASHHNDDKPKERTKEIIAKQFGVGSATVERAEHFVKGLDAADKVEPGFKNSVVAGEIKAPKNLISEIRNIPEAEQKKVISAVRRGDIDEAKAIIKPHFAPKPVEEKRSEYNAKDFYADLKAAVQNFDFALNQHMVLVHGDMLDTEAGQMAALKALYEGADVVQKYLKMIEEILDNEKN